MITVQTLPQAAHTVISVTMPAQQWSVREDEPDPGATEEAVLVRSPSGHWGTAYGWRKIWLDDAGLLKLIDGFTVLAEPTSA